jgi:hypothetical protein
MAGQLKCQYRMKLSYNDCIAIAIALQKKQSFILQKKIYQKLKICKLSNMSSKYFDIELKYINNRQF